jgi:uncharacterized membrane protein
MSIFCLLGALCFIIPGIILYYSYSLSYFILADDPDITPYEALKKSAAMMKGHRWDPFKLQFSFIGWHILCALSMGIGYLWLSPYIACARAHFYETVKAEYQNK